MALGCDRDFWGGWVFGERDIEPVNIAVATVYLTQSGDREDSVEEEIPSGRKAMVLVFRPEGQASI